LTIVDLEELLLLLELDEARQYVHFLEYFLVTRNGQYHEIKIVLKYRSKNIFSNAAGGTKIIVQNANFLVNVR